MEMPVILIQTQFRMMVHVFISLIVPEFVEAHFFRMPAAIVTTLINWVRAKHFNLTIQAVFKPG
jgi:hypothetical protein